jgi:outer membrane protein assembly factor BamB
MTDFNTLGTDELGANKIARSATAFSLYNNPIAIARAGVNAPKIVTDALQQKIRPNVGLYKRFGYQRNGGFIGRFERMDENLQRTDVPIQSSGASVDAFFYHPSGFAVGRNGSTVSTYAGHLKIADISGFGTIGTPARESLFLDDDLNIYTGGATSTVRKVSFGGTAIWSVTTSGSTRAVTVRRDGAVFSGSADGTVHRIDQTSGGTSASLTWSVTPEANVVQGLCYDLAGNIYVSYDTGSRGRVYRLNPDTGAAVWGPYDIAQRGRGLAFGPGNMLIFGTGPNQRVIRLNPDTGAEIWNVTPNGTDVGNALTVSIRADGIIYVSGGNGIGLVSPDGVLLGGIAGSVENHARCELGVYGYHWDDVDPEA